MHKSTQVTLNNGKTINTIEVALTGRLYPAVALAKRPVKGGNDVIVYAAHTSRQAQGGPYVTVGTCQYDERETFGSQQGVYVPGLGMEFDLSDFSDERLEHWIKVQHNLPQHVFDFVHQYFNPTAEQHKKTVNEVLV
jgi:hypothetical protein